MDSGIIITKDSDLKIKVLNGSNTVDWRAAEIFARVINERTGLKISVNSDMTSKYTLIIANQTDYEMREYSFDHNETLKLKNDGFFINTNPDEKNNMYIIGDTPSGTVAGIGKLMRLSIYEKAKFALPKIHKISNPDMPVRGVYFASHFGNFYEVAPIEEVDRYIEDMALWGANSLMVWFDQHQYKDFKDSAAKLMVSRLRHFGNTAQSMGMKFGLTVLANEGYAGSPEEYRVKVLNPGNYGVEMCPSIPEALDLIVKNQEEILQAFPKVDTVWLWPYDQGGCWCDKCLPWGGNGFLKASEKLAGMYKKYFPNVEIWLSTWKMDYFQNTQGEINGVLKYIKDNKPSWLTGIITGQDEYSTQQALLDRPYPGRYPLVSFPEISMYNMYPWGGFGATSLPDFNSKVQSLMRSFISGGWLYSEGIFEDLSKFQWISFYWNNDAKADDILKEYASYYLNPGVAEDFIKIAYLLEKTHYRSNWVIKSLDGADEAGQLAKSIDLKIDDWSRKSWRWRLFNARVSIDAILVDHSPASEEGQVKLKPYCDEIIDICSLQKTHLRPPDFPRTASPNNLAFGKHVISSSVLPGYEGSEKYLVDGYLPHDSPESFWVNDSQKEEISHIIIDFEDNVDFNEVRLQFRALENIYRFVPSGVSFSISADGKNFDPVSIMHIDSAGFESGPYVSTKNVPKENSPYDPAFWRYKIIGGSQGARYLRIELDRSQNQTEPYKGMIELTEIEVI